MSREDAVSRAEIRRVSYAQNMEDILLDRVFGDHVGTYLDIGANNPFVDSNTQFFSERGWRGVNIEPTREGHELFMEHRPRDLNLAVAVSDTEGLLDFYEIKDSEGNNGLSTLSAEMAALHRERLDCEVDQYQVPVHTLATLIETHQIEPPDFVSIDVENHEEHVLRGIPLATWRPKVVLVESTIPCSEVPSYQSWEPILLEHGYVFAAFNGINRIYLREDLQDKLERLQSPVNVLDRYVRSEYVELEKRLEDLCARHYECRTELDRVRSERDWERGHFDEVRTGWQWGLAKSEQAQQAWEYQCALFDRQRDEWKATWDGFQKAIAEWDRERAGFAQERADFEKGRAQFYFEREAWERHRQELERLLELGRQERSAWELERAAYHQQLTATQQQLHVAQSQHGATQEHLVTVQEQLGVSQQQLGTVQEQLGTVREQLGTVQVQLGASNERLALANEHYVSTLQHLNATHEQLGATEEQLSAVEEKLRKSQEHLVATHRELIATQRLLRPYRLLDRVGAVTAGYGLARRIKHKLAS